MTVQVDKAPRITPDPPIAPSLLRPDVAICRRETGMTQSFEELPALGLPQRVGQEVVGSVWCSRLSGVHDDCPEGEFVIVVDCDEGTRVRYVNVLLFRGG